MTFFLCLCMLAGFAWQLESADPGVAVLGGALVPYNLTHDVTLGVPVALTPVSSLGLHGSVWHLASNALVLLAVGPAIEARCGPWRFLAFFLLCGIAGGLMQTVTAPDSHRPIIGASGAIAGVLAAYALRYPLARDFFGVPVVVPIVVWAGIQCVQSGILTTSASAAVVNGNEPIAYAAHVGGFLMGAFTIGLFEPRSEN